MESLYGKHCIVTGADSMIGSATCEAIRKVGGITRPISHEKYNLCRKAEAQDIFIEYKCDYLFHLAGYNGGIDFNKKYPADIFYNTVYMGINVLHSALLFSKSIKKILFILPSCALEPSDGEQTESNLYSGPCHPSVECHGLAKRAVEAYGRQIQKQHGIKFTSVICNNSFGPGDRFCEERGKVISGLIRRFVDAKERGLEEVVCWGTGAPLREFIYSKDVANGLVQIMEKYDLDYPINLTSDFEISIYDLSHVIAKAVGYKGFITFDTTKQDGQMRKKLNSHNMHKHIKLDITPFDEAIKETVEWYLNNR